MADFKFYIDSLPVKNPIGWEVFTTGYVRILDTRGATVAKPEGELTFYEDGYDYLLNLWAKGGPCGESTFKIEYRCSEFDAYATLFEGVIRASDVEYDPLNCTAKVAQIVDNSYISQINTNGDIKAYANVGRSKNDQTITAKTSINLSFFNPASGVYAYANRPGYQVFDLFEYLVDFCTGGALSFASDFFGAGGAGEGVFLIMGSSLRTGNVATPFISFNELLLEMHKIYNVVVVIDDSGATPVIRVDSASTTYEEVTGSIISGEDVNNVKWRAVPFGSGDTPYNGDKPITTYTNLEIGSKTTQSTNGGAFQYPDIVYVGHKEEEYHITGDCAFKQTLELVNNWIIDSNVIEDVLVTPSTAYDDDIFIVETDYPAFATATNATVINPGLAPFTYNAGAFNSEKVLRFLGAVPGSVAKFLGNGNDEFQAQDTVGFNYTFPVYGPVTVLFNDDFTPPNNDPNGNYTPGTGQYTCPANGIYTFNSQFRFVSVFLGLSNRFDYFIDYLRNGVSVYQETGSFTTDTIIYSNPPAFYLNAADTMEVQVQIQDVPGDPTAFFTMDQAFYRCTNSANGGGIYQEVNTAQYRGRYYIFDYPMSFTDFLSYVSYANRFENTEVQFTDSTKNFNGWIVQARYKIGKDGGIATIELVSTS